MAAIATITCAMISFSVFTYVSKVTYFRDTQKKKSEGLGSGQHGGQDKRPPFVIHIPGYLTLVFLHIYNEKCFQELSYTNNMPRYI